MALEFHDGKVTGSSGVAKAGLALGIVGASLGALNAMNGGCNGWLGNGWLGNGVNNLFGNRGCNGCGNGYFGPYGYGNGYAFGESARAEVAEAKIAKLDSTIAELESMRYADYVGIDLYKNLIAEVRDEDKKISDLQGTMFAYLVDLDKRTALNAQAQELNRQYDTASRDYMFTILNNKIDCCCEKAAMQACFDRQTAQANDAAIVAYANSTFVNGQLKLPITSICPQPATATTTA